MTTKYKGFKESLLESIPENIPVYSKPPEKRLKIIIPLGILCIIEGWHFFDIFSIKINQNANDSLGYYNYSLLYLFTILFFSIPSMYLIETDVSIAIIISCVIELLSCYFSFLLKYRILIEFSAFTSCIAMIFLFKSLGKIAQLWYVDKEKNLVITSLISLIFFGGGISFLTYNRKLVEWGAIKILSSFIKFCAVLPCLGLLLNPLPDKFISEKQYDRLTHKFKIMDQVISVLLNNTVYIISVSLIFTSFVFSFLSFLDAQENMMRPPGYLIGMIFILSVFFIGLIYFYFQKYQEYSFLSKTNLIVCIASYFLIILYFLIIISKTILRMPTIPILIHFVFGLAMVLFIIINYDVLCEESFPYGESCILTICEVITCVFSLILISLNYTLRSNVYYSNQRWVEIIIFLFPFLFGCLLNLPTGDFMKESIAENLNKLSIQEETISG